MVQYFILISTVNPSNAEAIWLKHMGAKIFENHVICVVLVFIGKLLLSTFEYPFARVSTFNHFSVLLHQFLLAKLDTSSIRVNGTLNIALLPYKFCHE